MNGVEESYGPVTAGLNRRTVLLDQLYKGRLPGVALAFDKYLVQEGEEVVYHSVRQTLEPLVFDRSWEYRLTSGERADLVVEVHAEEGRIEGGAWREESRARGGAGGARGVGDGGGAGRRDARVLGVGGGGGWGGVGTLGRGNAGWVRVFAHQTNCGDLSSSGCSAIGDVAGEVCTGVGRAECTVPPR